MLKRNKFKQNKKYIDKYFKLLIVHYINSNVNNVNLNVIKTNLCKINLHFINTILLFGLNAINKTKLKINYKKYKDILDLCIKLSNINDNNSDETVNELLKLITIEINNILNYYFDFNDLMILLRNFYYLNLYVINNKVNNDLYLHLNYYYNIRSVLINYFPLYFNEISYIINSY